mmetsp:Transcript_40124/g.119525  ORF Transcript_40124/g.119525 Transcript_40124/m.119525 type:complete len:338 (-) Transcript_40124:2265-3278(-)
MVHENDVLVTRHAPDRRVAVHARVVFQVRVRAADQRRNVRVHAVLHSQRHVREAVDHESLEHRHVEVQALAALLLQVPAVHLGPQLLVVSKHDKLLCPRAQAGEDVCFQHLAGLLNHDNFRCIFVLQQRLVLCSCCGGAANDACLAEHLLASVVIQPTKLCLPGLDSQQKVSEFCCPLVLKLTEPCTCQCKPRVWGKGPDVFRVVIIHDVCSVIAGHLDNDLMLDALPRTLGLLGGFGFFQSSSISFDWLRLTLQPCSPSSVVRKHFKLPPCIWCDAWKVIIEEVPQPSAVGSLLRLDSLPVHIGMQESQVCFKSIHLGLSFFAPLHKLPHNVTCWV